MCIFSFLLTVKAVTPDPQGHHTLTQVGGWGSPLWSERHSFPLTLASAGRALPLRVHVLAHWTCKHL